MRRTPLSRYFDSSGQHDGTQNLEAWGLRVSFSTHQQDYWRLVKRTAFDFECFECDPQLNLITEAR